jgi:hypothetical protein
MADLASGLSRESRRPGGKKPPAKRLEGTRMDSECFDRLATVIGRGTSRRGVLGGLLGSALVARGLAWWEPGQEAAAKKDPKHKHKHKGGGNGQLGGENGDPGPSSDCQDQCQE